MGNKLQKNFFLREDIVQISRDLIGKFLVTEFDGRRSSGMIVETEAYRGPEDRACHAFNNRCTDRTRIMFAEGGYAYVFLCYGIHHLFNVVTGQKEQPHAVLIRAIEPVDNLPLMLERRKMPAAKRSLTAGPGALSQALGIHTGHSGLDLTQPNSPIWLEDRQIHIAPGDMLESPRVGVAYAREWAALPWRFRLQHSKWTSPAK